MNNREFAINFFEEKAKNMTASDESIRNGIDYLQKEIEIQAFQFKISEVLSNFDLLTATKNENTEDFSNNNIEVTISIYGSRND